MKRKLIFERQTVERVVLDVDVPSSMAATDVEALFNHGGFDSLLTNAEPRSTMRERHDWKLIGAAGDEYQPTSHNVEPTQVESRTAKRIGRKR